MKRNNHRRVPLAAVALLGLMALLQQWAEQRRPEAAWLESDKDFFVTSPEDRGPGSLREAIFAADSAKERARIVIEVSEVVLRTPLPPLVNPQGVIVQAAAGGTVIDAREIGAGAVLDIGAPHSAITGLTIRHAPEQAILARAQGLRLQDFEAVECDVGVYVAEGVSDVVVAESRFEANRMGVWLAAENSAVILRNNEFSAHKDAAVWMVSRALFEIPQLSTVRIIDNRFSNDRLSVVAANVSALIEDNEFAGAGEAAVYLSGAGAVVRGNRIRNGARAGIVTHEARGAVITNNEVDHNQSLAIMVRSSQDTVIQSNRVYSNGYGIAFVLGAPRSPNVASDNTLLGQRLDGIILVGESPLLRKNEMLNNQEAGLRILDFLPLESPRIPSTPFLAENTLRGNRVNEPVRGEYRVRRGDE